MPIPTLRGRNENGNGIIRRFIPKGSNIDPIRRTIEPVFGQIKNGRGNDSFYGRERVLAKGEWILIRGTRDLLKLFGNLRTARN